MESENDDIKLSASTLDALKEFYSERDQRQQEFEDLKAEAENQASDRNVDMAAFTEDWNASQFWYSEDTAKSLAEQLLDGATNDTWIAVVSAPSVFVQLRNIMSNLPQNNRPQVRLLEYDDRFAVFSEFIFYDFNSPLKLPADFKGRFNRIICDPPFLSEDCQTKAALTARWLLRPDEPSKGANAGDKMIIVCTGERMESLILKVYPVKTTTFEPEHNGSRLSNAFRCYANFECSAWRWR
ncbi:MAG: hypothetical protein M1834_008853 [Cirrosporium novae-zelandiae]|nr:MAG: hypothetical protein M1834_008853 [Cirrosporium novae-zelandiae]